MYVRNHCIFSTLKPFSFFTILILCLLLAVYGCLKEEKKIPVKKPANTVRAAAIQCYSRMGKIKHNREVLTRLIEKASEKGAKIIVTPECAVTGYMDPANNITWSKDEPDEKELAIQDAAETVPGPSTKYFSELAKKHKIYLCIGLAEKADKQFYNSQVLFDPKGNIIGHHRKQNRWPPGDGMWVSKGEKLLQVIDTPFGKLGMMICYDTHVLAEKLGEKKADIVLYSVGWYGLNTKGWYRLTRKARDGQGSGTAVSLMIKERC
jgi:predicted amidohydrolase